MTEKQEKLLTYLRNKKSLNRRKTPIVISVGELNEGAGNAFPKEFLGRSISNALRTCGLKCRVKKGIVTIQPPKLEVANPVMAALKEERINDTTRNQGELLNGINERITLLFNNHDALRLGLSQIVLRLDAIDTNMGGNNQGLQEVQKGIDEILRAVSVMQVSFRTKPQSDGVTTTASPTGQIQV